MTLIGRLHPLLIHFPIALVMAAAAAEGFSLVRPAGGWRSVAVRNLRAAAAFAVVAAVAGWRLALQPGMEPSSLLEWHRWLGTIAAGTTFVAALATIGKRSALAVWMYRIALFAAGALVGLTGHLGGVLVWGPNFLRP